MFDYVIKKKCINIVFHTKYIISNLKSEIPNLIWFYISIFNFIFYLHYNRTHFLLKKLIKIERINLMKLINILGRPFSVRCLNLCLLDAARLS